MSSFSRVLFFNPPNVFSDFIWFILFLNPKSPRNVSHIWIHIYNFFLQKLKSKTYQALIGLSYHFDKNSVYILYMSFIETMHYLFSSYTWVSDIHLDKPLTTLGIVYKFGYVLIRHFEGLMYLDFNKNVSYPHIVLCAH
ncbi:hypothetical protein ACJX0J_009001, partial [Zea mays]